jgi:hypothetical protein
MVRDPPPSFRMACDGSAAAIKKRPQWMRAAAAGRMIVSLSSLLLTSRRAQ